jgi:hypothetical protein
VLALCPLIPIELFLCCSLISLFFLIIGVSFSGIGMTSSLLRSSTPYPKPFIDFLVFRTNPVTPERGSKPIDFLGSCLGGEAGRGADGRVLVELLRF